MITHHCNHLSFATKFSMLSHHRVGSTIKPSGDQETREVSPAIRQGDNNAKLTKARVFWVALGVVALTLFLGFSQAGWMTKQSAEQLTEIATQNALVERLAPICVSQFNEDTQREEKLSELAALTTPTRRAAYVNDQGWATMPGEENPDKDVAIECAKQIMLLDR